ncbi:YbaK/EbsC family protein [Clostridium grantii]|uniref:Cys-tRNA(Pro) deacylase, prolyl-tRNA editing enzyme YbaK/EbsC n=1 Tax=Clostridium grantii DSM 8605 TaxID=1121316 RepID=A0A1M5XQG8_9CLOT|nr:YbaK/EbsC family protein [Clostridium grantii]SHI02061.1 Cys-tRNA(Pro) deacylase, prolyl-tRNA editing enzyme YbaK/EbsC [Clostridium grantii DSM 8605]
MSLKSVKNQFKEENLNLEIIEFKQSTATVELAAEALGVEPDRIAKTMAFKLKETNILVVSKGGARVDNRKFKDKFSEKPKMMNHEEVVELTGHPVGGVCPFGLAETLDIYLDNSLKEFDFVYPAAGTANTAVKISVTELEKITKGSWVDVCK